MFERPATPFQGTIFEPSKPFCSTLQAFCYLHLFVSPVAEAGNCTELDLGEV